MQLALVQDNQLSCGEQSTAQSAARSEHLASCSTEEARKYLSYKDAVRYGVLPVGIICDASQVKLLSVLTPEPVDPLLIQELRFVTGLEIVPEGVEQDALSLAIHKAYQKSGELLRVATQQVLNSSNSALNIEAADADFEQSSADKTRAVPEFFKALLERALAQSASDIHLEPCRHGLRVRFRIDGALHCEPGAEVTHAVARDLSRYIKVLARLNPAKPRSVQEGGFSYLVGKHRLRLRVSVLPTVEGEKIVCRVFENSFLDSVLRQAATEQAFNELAFNELGLRSQQRQLLIAYLSQQAGTILLAGPTGSGKSTLLYAALSFLNQEQRNICAIEDPVERKLDGITQIEVSSEQCLDAPVLATPRWGFAQYLKALLRQDPDVIMLGEIRDAQTAKVALTAGITGHLVLSTVHANDCIEVLLRLLELETRRELIATSVRLVIAQRLIPRNCSFCAQPQQLSASVARVLSLAAGLVVSSSPGCERCRNTGVLGRIGVFEFLPFVEPFRAAVLQHIGAQGEIQDLKMLRTVASEQGYQPLAFEIRELLVKGQISPDTALGCLGLGYLSSE